MPTIKEIEVVNSQGEPSSRDIGVEAQYVDVSKDALGNIVNKDEQVINESLTKILQKTNEIGAKNLVKCNLPTGTNYTIDNLTGVINNDFTVTINGSLLEGNDFLINQNNQPIFTAYLPKGTYKLSGCPNGGSQSSYYLGIYIEGIGPVEQTIDIGEGMIFTLSVPSNIRVSSYCVTGYTFSNIVFKPMITLENEVNNYNAYKESSMSNEQLTREMNKIMRNEVILPSKGGTGVTSLVEARAAMGLGNSNGPLDIIYGGTGAETAGAARQALGLGGTALSGDGPLSFVNGGTGSNNGRINDVLLFKEGNTYGYKDTDGVFHSFRQPTGNAVVGDVLSGKTFANASNDALTGTMMNYSGNNRKTVTPTGGTGNEQLSLSAGYHDSIIVNRTAPYNTGVAAQKNVSWEENFTFGNTDSANQPYCKLSLKNIDKIYVSSFSANIGHLYYEFFNKSSQLINSGNIEEQKYISIPSNAISVILIGNTNSTAMSTPSVNLILTRKCNILHN